MRPCGHETDRDGCAICNIARRDDRYRRLWDGLPPAQGRRRDRLCIHLGDATGETVGCSTCPSQAGKTAAVHHCAERGTCAPDLYRHHEVTGCGGCKDYTPRPVFAPANGDPACGVVVGSYGYPKLVELQIRLIRHTCGPVPILISDDLSPGGRDQQIRALADVYPGVEVQVAEQRIGHSGGDMAAFHRGIIWAHHRGIAVLAKLSHRFLITTPRWLQDGARGLLASRMPFGGQPCVEGRSVFPLRTEAVLLQVDRWYSPPVLQYLQPRPIGVACEPVIHHAGTRLVGGPQRRMWPWTIITRDRFRRTPGVLWHVCTPMQEYQALAAQFGIELDPDFSVGGNHLRGDYIVG